MRKVLKIKLIILIAVMSFLILLPTLTLATTEMQELLNQAAGEQGAGFETSSNLAKTGIASVVGTVAKVFLSFLGVIFISYTIYGGYLWMTARGNEEKVTKARDTIRDGIIGLIIVLSSWAIYVFIYTKIIVGA